MLPSKQVRHNNVKAYSIKQITALMNEVGESPPAVGKTPMGKTPVGKTPVGKTPVGKTPPLSHTDILHDPHVKQICTHSQHTSAGLTILNVPSSPKQLLPGMPSLKVWSLAPHWMHSRRHCHWGDRYHASVFEHTNLACF